MYFQDFEQINIILINLIILFELHPNIVVIFISINHSS